MQKDRIELWLYKKGRVDAIWPLPKDCTIEEAEKTRPTLMVNGRDDFAYKRIDKREGF